MFLNAFKSSRSKSDNGSVSTTLRPRTSSSTLASSFSSRPKLPFTSSNTVNEENESDLRDLNTCLLVLADIFPEVRPDVFREMLSSLSEESRLHVVADQLLTFGPKWIQGRWRISAKVTNSKILNEVMELEGRDMQEPKELMPLEEQFRSNTYKTAVRVALEDEFRNLSRTVIDGVLAEQNFSYTNSRPVLAGLAARSWRINFKALMKWRKPTESHFMLLPARTPAAGAVYLPQLRKTGSSELDAELYETVLKPILENDLNAKDMISQELAILLNNADAKEHEAVYECECCYNEVAFESIAVCSTGDHILCFSCLQNTVSAALYAQTWSRSIDHDRSAISCFAPSSIHCEGYIPGYLTERALLQVRGGAKTWEKLEQKLATDARKSVDQKYIECPFCEYAEADEVYWPTGSLVYKFKGIQQVSELFSMLLALLIAIPLSWQYFWISLLFSLQPIGVLFQKSLDSLARKNCLSLRFNCLSPDCQRSSCRSCKVPWRDPHKCNEKEEISLRTSIEAAKSAATKRVCPKCNVSFVKESGCNKMTCTCGYTMCYLCRQGLGQSTNKDNPHDDHDYSHFCGHFRAFPGRCMQCDKCDLYREGNQEEIIRKAGETAEKEWKSKQSKGKGSQIDMSTQGPGIEVRFQAFVDKVVETFITC